MTDTPSITRKTPGFTAWFVPDREGCPWVPIGAAWEHQDGNGFNLKLDLIPHAAGRIMLRRIKQSGAEQATQTDGGQA